MKAILISIKPKWVADILNGKKTIEVRLKFPAYRGWVYIYCTKDSKNYLYGDKSVYKGKKETFWCQSIKGNGIVPLLNGKVVARFYCENVEELPFSKRQKQWANNELAFGCQLTYTEFCDYLQYKTGYAIHISDLEIFDKPKELSEFKRCQLL